MTTPKSTKVPEDEKKVSGKLALAGSAREASKSLFREMSLLIGERTLEIAAALFAMVLVERGSGQSGLGVYSYLLSLYSLTGYLAEWGIPHWVERETALHAGGPSRDPAALTGAYRALLTLGFCAALLLFASAAFDTAQTRIEERMGAYFIIGLAIPVRNVNRLRLALLNGAGRHDEAAGLQGKKRFVFLGTVFLLTSVGTQPSFLVVSFLAGELYLLAAGRKRLKLPAVRSAPADPERTRATLREGSRLLFTDDALEVILYVDLLVLGFFMPSWDLGVYAEASVLARFFLLIPLSLRPVLRRKVLVPAGLTDFSRAAEMARGAAARLFALHSFLAVYLLLFFPDILRLFFHTRGEEPASFQVFKIFTPGLLYAASAIALEPLHEALGKAESLKRLILIVLGTNFVLNAYLVPIAGLAGAAWATMLSMLLHFLLVGMCLDRQYRLHGFAYLTAGAAVYLVGRLMEALHAGAMLSACLLPVLLGSLFYAIGFLNGEINPNQIGDGGESGGRTEKVDLS